MEEHLALRKGLELLLRASDIGLAGVAVLAGPDLVGDSTWPIIEVLLVATCYAIAPLIAARYLADVPTLPMTAACLSVADLSS